jgi:hypothetical protein
LRCRFCSEDPQRRSGDQVSLKIERVVDGGMDGLSGGSSNSVLERLAAAQHRPGDAGSLVGHGIAELLPI